MINKGIRIVSKAVHDEALKSFMKQWIGEHDFYLFTPDDNKYGWVDEPKITSARFCEIVLKHKEVYLFSKKTDKLTLHYAEERKGK